MKKQVITPVLPSPEERRAEMIALSLEIIMAGVMLPSGIFSAIEMNRTVQRLPAHFSTLIFLPFAAGLALTALVSPVRKLLPLR